MSINFDSINDLLKKKLQYDSSDESLQPVHMLVLFLGIIAEKFQLSLKSFISFWLYKQYLTKHSAFIHSNKTLTVENQNTLEDQGRGLFIKFERIKYQCTKAD